MGASVCWRPVKRTTAYLDVNQPSDFGQAVEKVFGGLPRKFSYDDVLALRVLADLTEDKHWEDIIQLISENEEIEISLEY